MIGLVMDLHVTYFCEFFGALLTMGCSVMVELDLGCGNCEADRRLRVVNVIGLDGDQVLPGLCEPLLPLALPGLHVHGDSLDHVIHLGLGLGGGGAEHNIIRIISIKCHLLRIEFSLIIMRAINFPYFAFSFVELGMLTHLFAFFTS